MAGLAITPIGDELLDQPDADPAIVAESLRNIARANRWFGGSWVVRYGLARTLKGVPAGSSLSLLDLGTGLGDLPRAAVHWGARRNIRIIPVGLELNRSAAKMAQSSGLATTVACAGAPPVADKGVDVVLVSQLAHHLTQESVLHLIRTCDRLARKAVILADLRRHRLAPPIFWCGARMFGFDPVTVSDGMTSLRRGFTRLEMERLLASAGVAGEVAQRPGFRLVATWKPRER
jgi:2-polyprenyl-3-methyl-5-hydroxy-6-metoxy-1,4-benzoquinol methylase